MPFIMRSALCLTTRFNAMRWTQRRTASSTEWPIISETDLRHLEDNVNLRQQTNNIPQIRALLSGRKSLTQLQIELSKLPNDTHPRLSKYDNEPHELLRYEPLKAFGTAMEFSEICKHFNLLRTTHLSNYTGHKSYYLQGQLAELEQALVQYALVVLKKQKFALISVPDLLPAHIIAGCGMTVDGERNQIYKLDSGDCLSGTSEMALAGFYADRVLDEECLPLKVMAVSRCYRAETSGLQEEKGIYRVHQFTKVEMFSVCTESQSAAMLTEFRDIQVALFKELNLHFRLIDMPPFELGAPAYEKYDIEAWLPGRQMWGELSSCSNCTDYQAKRLQIRYRAKDNEIKYAHTVNGTAAAIPRLLIAIVESNQLNDAISLPAALVPFMTAPEIRRNKNIPDVKLVKTIKCA